MAALALCLYLAQLAIAGPVSAERERPAPVGVTTLEMFLAGLAVTRDLDINRPADVASFVFMRLANRVRVYPTENYYYFRFIHRGLIYTGNFRLDVRDRDDGKLHFAYQEELTDWKTDGPTQYLVLDATSGFKVRRLRKLSYEVSHNGKRVNFALNDLSGVRPPAGLTRAGETFIGPVFDESGLRFFLLYASRSHTFLYVLDPISEGSDQFDSLGDAQRISIGRRTGFAFYRDNLGNRRILIGVNRRNTLHNTYFDGPFDQLPENFLTDDRLRQSIVDYDSKVEGKIDRYGYFAPAVRYTISPYMLYGAVTELHQVATCAEKERHRPPSYYGCFDNSTDK